MYITDLRLEHLYQKSFIDILVEFMISKPKSFNQDISDNLTDADRIIKGLHKLMQTGSVIGKAIVDKDNNIQGYLIMLEQYNVFTNLFYADFYECMVNPIRTTKTDFVKLFKAMLRELKHRNISKVVFTVAPTSPLYEQMESLPKKYTKVFSTYMRKI